MTQKLKAELATLDLIIYDLVESLAYDELTTTEQMEKEAQLEWFEDELDILLDKLCEVQNE